MRSRDTLALVLASSLAAGCEPRLRCDEAELVEIAEGLEQVRVDEADAIEDLAVACPRLNRALVEELLAAVNPELAFARPQRPSSAETEALAGLRERVCASALRAASTDAAALAERCELQRYGLLEAGEPILLEDLPAYDLAEQLREAKVDEATARRVARSLMSATLEGARARQRCEHSYTSFACVEAARADGIELPRSTCDVAIKEGRVVRISSRSLEIEGATVVPLAAGRLPDSALDGRVISAMAEFVEASEEAAVGEEGRMGLGTLHVEADAGTPYATLIRALNTAQSIGHGWTSLLVTDGRGRRMMRVSPPREGAKREPLEGAAAKIFARLEIPASGGMRLTAEGDTQTLDSRAELEQAARRVAGSGSRIRAVIVEAHDALSVGELVGILDALRGPECRLATHDLDAPLPETCWLVQVSLAFES